jgi:hypothetical protein
MTAGERRFAERLEQKLEEDYLCWYDVPIGPANMHPDFVVLHPRRGLIILEVKDWKLDTLVAADRFQATIKTSAGQKQVSNPLEQARQYAFAVADLLKRDESLRFSSGDYAGHLIFPWAYGVVLTNITRAQFERSGLVGVMAPNHVICSDEMTDTEDVERFQTRLWDMFSVHFKSAMTLPQIDRVRWHMFPEIRIQQGLLFEEDKDVMRVMDLQQEQLARSLGDGHRVIHGVAGSGKTLILGYRAQHLAQVCVKPVLVLCYNKALAKRLACTIETKGLSSKIKVQPFHQWCRAQLVAFHGELPPANPGNLTAWAEQLVDNTIRAVDRGLIPKEQYDAVLLDEGHDFHPEWLKLIVQMVDPRTNSLLLLYDDAQAIYPDLAKRRVSFKSLGIQAVGRTTILRVNYRNTQEILNLAVAAAAELLKSKDSDEDGIPLVAPVGAGRKGPAPILIKLPTIAEESGALVERLKAAHREGIAWRDMAVIYRENWKVGAEVMSAARRAGIPAIDHAKASFADGEDMVKFLTMHSCKGLEFRFVAIPGTRYLAQDGEAAKMDARLLYVAMTRATQQLVVFQ